ncbi:hypothetical protein LOAG_12208 [Loa loa]|uniref:Uncharacterized protein n=1 Tax=Loa loa TaxID=7209 RepID=A0A1S0TM59_LOALO|nr:hypothetical protein LOAG_12208 [Loa loa]EFO16300.1 hypothetical protein LOAG_12208 [Loa loa]
MSDVYHPGSGGSKGFPPAPYGYPMHCNMSRAFQEMTDDERKCLDERKYWCFLLSRMLNNLLKIISSFVIIYPFYRIKLYFLTKYLRIFNDILFNRNNEEEGREE